jgi:hypothetical protein
MNRVGIAGLCVIALVGCSGEAPPSEVGGLQEAASIGPPLPPLTGSGPNLVPVVLGITCPTANDPGFASVTYAVKNVGNAVAGSSAVAFLANTNVSVGPVITWLEGGLSPGQASAPITSRFPDLPHGYVVQEFTYSVTADLDSDVVETNEQDNTLKSFVCVD